jgi:hypothetical protein
MAGPESKVAIDRRADSGRELLMADERPRRA